MNAASAATAQDSPSDRRFEMRPDGLWCRSEDKPPLRVAGYFEVLCETLEDEAQTWGLLIRFPDRDHATQQIILTRDLFAGEGVELRNVLARRGLYINPVRRAGATLCEYLSIAASRSRARIVSRTGWHRIDGEQVFILPDAVFGHPRVEVILQSKLREASLFNSAGTLDEWREIVAARCIGNTRLVLAVSTAFAAPLLHLVGDEGGGLHIRGESRVGKTTALRVAASVWGGDQRDGGARAYVRQWRATSNAVEGVAAAHSDTLLALDELGQVDGRDVGSVAYMLSNGIGKARADRTGALRPPPRFRALFLSSGEQGLADKIAEAGGSVKAGQEVRLGDVPADAGRGLGLFEELHDAESAAALAQALLDTTGHLYGTAAPAFLTYLLQRLAGEDELPTDLRRWQDVLVKGWLEPFRNSGGQVRSVARRFALIAVGGELATMAGITGWDPNEATDAAEACFHAWLTERGTEGAREEAQAVEQLAAFIARHGSSRFEEWRDRSATDEVSEETSVFPPPERFRTINRAGWRRWVADGADGTCWLYYILPSAMREALAGLDFRASLKVLIRRDLLVPGSSGRSSQSPSPPGHPKARVYLIRSSILGYDGSVTAG